MLPPEPSGVARSRPGPEGAGLAPGELTWRWALLDAAGAPVDAQGAEARFPSQAEAESWLGEAFGDLAEAGVDQVTLYDADRAVYGPMSLHP